MEILNLTPETEVYFKYDGKFRNGIFKGVQRTLAGKVVKKGNRLVEIINKHGNISTLIVPKETKFFDTEESLVEYADKLRIEFKKKTDLFKEEFEKDMEKVKKDLNKIENINELPIFKQMDWEKHDYYNDLFDDSYVFILKDGTKVKMIKSTYQCILHSFRELEGIEVYEIDDGELFKCLDCGELLVRRNDLIEKYYSDASIYREFLFPKSWSESGIIEWIKRYVRRNKIGYVDDML